MPDLETKYFGTLAFEPSAIIAFPAGLPGFEGERQFVFIEQPEHKPLVFLQSLSQPDLCFIGLPVLALCPQYELRLTEEDLSALELPAGRQPAIGAEVLCVALISLSEDCPPTANLLSPIVVSLATRRALQAIQADSGYALQHPLPPPEEAPCS